MHFPFSFFSFSLSLVCLCHFIFPFITPPPLKKFSVSQNKKISIVNKRSEPLLTFFYFAMKKDVGGDKMKSIKMPVDIFVKICKYFIVDGTTEDEKNENKKCIKEWLWDKIDRLDKHIHYNKKHPR